MAERQLRSRLQCEESTVSEAPEAFKASRHRRTAAACGIFAANAVSSADRELLLRMQRSRLERARHEDWLDGEPPKPPARPNALAVPKRS
jgi:hypothetical protein